ncbi:MAG: hypothetical protein AB7S54_03250 [Bacteroidales bacterium]
MAITKAIQIEDLVEQLPESVTFLKGKGILCIICGEPIWGTLHEVASLKGYSDGEIDTLVAELNKLK